MAPTEDPPVLISRNIADEGASLYLSRTACLALPAKAPLCTVSAVPYITAWAAEHNGKQ